MTITELRKKRASVWETAKNFLNSQRQENGLLSAEDDATYSRMEKEITDLGAEIARLERQESIEAELSKPVNQPITGQPMRTGEQESTRPRATKAYREDFLNIIRGKAPIHNVLSTNPGSDGGYLVPEEFERQIITALEEENVFRKIAKVIKTEHDRKIPVAGEHSVAQWTDENGAYTESNPTFGQIELDAYKLTDLIRVSDELLQDSMFDIESYLSGEFARAFGVREEEAFCVGNGTKKPTGLFTANGGQVGVTATGTAAITADELISLIYSLKAPYRKNARFLLNDATVSHIRKLKDGNGVYLWQPSLVAGQPDKLLGYDLYTSAYVPTLAASAYTVAFGDFSYYWIADRQNRILKRLIELYATNGQVGFVASQRVDGKIILPEGIKLLQQHAA
ncbi:MAG: phage major capsid protein [Oscillospiraceae bacterium]|nr:phage major capsid protein [Oscillospiraceae bacterium]